MGWKLRWEIMQTSVYRRRQERERAALGVPRGGDFPPGTPLLKKVRAAAGEGEAAVQAETPVADESGKYTL